mmetsp:Transcript_913/g.1810  ORF Transcript_913/g.1810 Transcript_913/m.1810 type:complete len:83 (-) Transcript_913:2714-2962(-)
MNFRNSTPTRRKQQSIHHIIVANINHCGEVLHSASIPFYNSSMEQLNTQAIENLPFVVDHHVWKTKKPIPRPSHLPLNPNRD